jgi:D-alanyl-D-alanine carboxypeptidase (penicillin-binding protein 5/6)
MQANKSWKKMIALAVIAMHLPAFAQAFETKAREAIVVDVPTSTILYEKNAHESMPPSSMSKLMTAYVAFNRLKRGELKLDDELPVSEKAWRMGGSRTYLDVNTYVKVEDLLRGMIIQSGNDACVVLAEGISGSEEAFAEEMNRIAKEIGLKESNFVNSTGWPDPQHYMTAYDLSVLARRIIVDFPEYYHFYSEKEFTYNKITQPNRNTLLRKNIGVDGLKTGHTEVAGYGITISGVNKEGRRLIVVVNGLKSMAERIAEAEKLLGYGFREYANLTLARKGDPVGKAKVWFGAESSVPLIAADDIIVNVPRAARNDVKMEIVYKGPLEVPVKASTEVAKLRVSVPGREQAVFPLLAAKNIEAPAWQQRIVPAIQYYLFGSIQE